MNSFDRNNNLALNTNSVPQQYLYTSLSTNKIMQPHSQERHVPNVDLTPPTPMIPTVPIGKLIRHEIQTNKRVVHTVKKLDHDKFTTWPPKSSWLLRVYAIIHKGKYYDWPTKGSLLCRVDSIPSSVLEEPLPALQHCQHGQESLLRSHCCCLMFH